MSELWSYLWVCSIPALFVGFALSLIECASQKIAHPVNINVFGYTMRYWLLAVIFDITSSLQQLLRGEPLPQFILWLAPIVLVPLGLLAWSAAAIVTLYRKITIIR